MIEFKIKRKFLKVPVVFIGMLCYMNLYTHNSMGQETKSVLPEYTVHQYAEPESGYLFLGMIKGQDNFLLISDNNGTPIYVKKTESPVYDFKVQENGYLTYFEKNKGKFFMMDSAFQVVDSFTVANGYETNFHDFKVLNDGHILILGNEYTIVDMSAIIPGGHSFATVIQDVIQEFDENKNLLFEWNSGDHFDITDTYLSLLLQSIDYAHLNAVELDFDGNLILSSCYMSEITKINRTTGDIIWRLGGKNNEFDFTNDPIGFSYQHSAKMLNDSIIYLFDNGIKHELDYSRGLLYSIDQDNKILTLENEYRHMDNILTRIMGSIQHLPNKNMLVGWGGNKEDYLLTEFDSLGSPVLDMYSSYQTYRAFRFPWKTNKFYSNIDSLNFDTVEYNKDSIVQIGIQNNSNEILELSGYTNFNSVFEITQDFPIYINANDYINLDVMFKPDKLGDNYEDILTINSDSYNNDLIERIAIQVDVYGYSPDIFPPEFISYPSSGSTGISLDTIINIVFNEPIRFINDNEINNNNIQEFLKLRKGSMDGEIINITTLINEDRNKIDITPEVYLNYSEDYFVVIENQIEDFNDNAISDSFVSFRTINATGVTMNLIDETVLFPNPSKDFVQISFHKKPQILRVSNMNGELVYLDNEFKELNNYKIDLKHRNSGIYIVIIVFEDGSVNTLKLIKN
jgi:Arylsulfotransferase (ASST)/Bacterial Ig-like domain/Secretion system C-terminal sorting domain/Cep192 domain 8